MKQHNRKLGLFGTALTPTRNNRYGIPVMGEIVDEIEPLLESSRYLEEAPFQWFTLSLRYGLKYEDQPTYRPISKKYGDLPLAIELDTHDLASADRAELKRLFTIATLKALIHAGSKYGLPTKLLELRLANLIL